MKELLGIGGFCTSTKYWQMEVEQSVKKKRKGRDFTGTPRRMSAPADYTRGRGLIWDSIFFRRDQEDTPVEQWWRAHNGASEVVVFVAWKHSACNHFRTMGYAWDRDLSLENALLTVTGDQVVLTVLNVHNQYLEVKIVEARADNTDDMS
jgi:hypothetical protein